ncbi:hypothetical protein FB45DRAFT_738396 [Roridomyces roridus]|uniref:Uncharacterized protein n=1 Tax=Roridomyces roridus TaxID=1738132 RepID=A0AAD7C719_9AGAR|nr:hypothetical protein FB45DRAFT_738396 [Roridomyces roridus]
MLNVHSRSTVAVLFTETGIMPLRPRRVRVLLGYLAYLLKLPRSSYARAALDSSIELAAKFPRKRSWAKDLATAISRLPFACPPLPLTHDTTHEEVEKYSELLEKCCLQWLQALVDTSHKLYLLRGRLEPQKNKPPAQVTATMRHYLSMVPTQSHREAVSSILMSTHQLGVEVLRYVDHAHPRLERERRLCCLCAH